MSDNNLVTTSNNVQIANSLFVRAERLAKVLDKVESEVEKIPVEKLSQEDLVSLYDKLSKNHMAILEFARKMLLLPKEAEDNEKVRSLINRLLSLGEGSLKRLETLIQDEEINN